MFGVYTWSARRTPQCEKWAQEIRKDVLKIFGINVDTILFIPPRHVPRTTSGKIQRKSAKEKYIENEWKNVIGISNNIQYVRRSKPTPTYHL